MVFKAKTVTLRRNKSQEERNVPLWYSSPKSDFLVSIVGSQGDTRGRVSSPKGSFEVGFVGANFNDVQKNKEKFEDAFKNQIKRVQGIDVKFKS